MYSQTTHVLCWMLCGCIHRLLMCDLYILADVFDRLLRRYAPPPLT
ncbi:MAG: hypothetical protein LUD00_03810 [Prevotellaceae bacterium]|nr:hypothetical protein [Prevotellaceae bacterium]